MREEPSCTISVARGAPTGKNIWVWQFNKETKGVVREGGGVRSRIQKGQREREREIRENENPKDWGIWFDDGSNRILKRGEREGLRNRRLEIHLQVRSGGNLLVKGPDATESAEDPGGNGTFLTCSTLFGCRGLFGLGIMIVSTILDQAKACVCILRVKRNEETIGQHVNVPAEVTFFY